MPPLRLSISAKIRQLKMFSFVDQSIEVNGDRFQDAFRRQGKEIDKRFLLWLP